MASAPAARQKKKVARILHPCQCLFICEGCLLKLDLIRRPIHREVSAFCKGQVVFNPCLTDLFGHHLFEDFAFVVLAFGNRSIEVFFGAEELRALRQEEKFLLVCGREADPVAGAATCLVKGEDHGEDFGSGFDEVNIVLEVEAEDVIVCVGKFVVLIDHGIEKRKVSHLWSSFLYSLLLSGIIIPHPGAFVKRFFKLFLIFFQTFQAVKDCIDIECCACPFCPVSIFVVEEYVVVNIEGVFTNSIVDDVDFIPLDTRQMFC